MRKLLAACLITVAVFLFGLNAATAGSSESDANWPSWRGPSGTGVASGAPPIEWAEDKNVRWKSVIPGLGSASPIVWGDRVYILTAIGETAAAAPAGGRRSRVRRHGPPAPTDTIEWAVIAYDANDGSEVWRHVARSQVPYAGRHFTNSYASASAVTDGEHLWAFFGSYGLHCLDMAGNPVWELDFGAMQTRLGFGEGASTALYGDTIVVIWDQEPQSWIGAFNKLTGEQLWRMDRDESTTWATPLIVEYAGTTQVITSGTTRVRSYDLADGKLLWEGPGLTANTIPSPVYEDGVVYLAAGFRGSALMAVDLNRAQGRIDDTEAILWRIDRDTPYVPSPLLFGDIVYYTKSNDAIITTVRASTGERIFGPQRIDGLRELYASPTAANGYVYLLGRAGGATVLRHGEEYEVVAQNVLDDGFDASPAIVGDSLYLRGRASLYRIAAPAGE